MKKSNFVSLISVSPLEENVNIYDSQRRLLSYIESENLISLDVAEYKNRSSSFQAEKMAAWCDFVDRIKFDFVSDRIIDATVTDDVSYDVTVRLLKNLCGAIADFQSEVRGTDIILSEDSARNYLYLIPSVRRYLHNVSIDADTGFVNLGFRSSNNEILTALVTGKGEIHYSFVGRGQKLVKIAGTAKIKDKRDFINFKKILRMLWVM
ncbi:hypothetical protein U2P60_06120 [Brucella sp. H1_1004]|uniref:hypothetical protein n=1 Tax=Brucella sp. H1_1004 TaxID=3110109 RepID=UPI0039B4A8FB